VGALDAIEARLRAATATRDEQIATGTDRVAAVARQLGTVRGVAETSAAVFSAELFGTRTFRNGRQLGAVMGWCLSPIGVTNACRTRGSAKPAARSCGGSACNWHGVGCAGNPPVH
jgi:transposase